MSRSMGQNKAIWALVTQLAEHTGRDVAEEAMRAICVDVSGSNSTRELSVLQADEVLTRLNARLAEYTTATPKQPGSVISEEDQAHIAALAEQLGWDSGRRAAFCRKMLKHPWPQTPKDADTIIEALKAIIVREAGTPSALEARVRALIGHARLNVWQLGFIADLVRRYDAATTAGAKRRVMTPRRITKLEEAEKHAGITRVPDPRRGPRSPGLDAQAVQ